MTTLKLGAWVLHNINFKDLWKNTIRLMIKWEPGRSAWSLGLYNGVDTHKMYTVFTHRIRGQENIVLAPARGQVTGGWTLLIAIIITHITCGHLHWSLELTDHASLHHTVLFGLCSLWSLSLSCPHFSPWIFMLLSPGCDAGTGAGVRGLAWCSH